MPDLSLRSKPPPPRAWPAPGEDVWGERRKRVRVDVDRVREAVDRWRGRAVVVPVVRKAFGLVRHLEEASQVPPSGVAAEVHAEALMRCLRSLADVGTRIADVAREVPAITVKAAAVIAGPNPTSTPDDVFSNLLDAMADTKLPALRATFFIKVAWLTSNAVKPATAAPTAAGPSSSLLPPSSTTTTTTTTTTLVTTTTALSGASGVVQSTVVPLNDTFALKTAGIPSKWTRKLMDWLRLVAQAASQQASNGSALFTKTLNRWLWGVAFLRWMFEDGLLRSFVMFRELMALFQDLVSIQQLPSAPLPSPSASSSVPPSAFTRKMTGRDTSGGSTLAGGGGGLKRGLSGPNKLTGDVRVLVGLDVLGFAEDAVRCGFGEQWLGRVVTWLKDETQTDLVEGLAEARARLEAAAAARSPEPPSSGAAVAAAAGMWPRFPEFVWACEDALAKFPGSFEDLSQGAMAVIGFPDFASIVRGLLRWLGMRGDSRCVTWALQVVSKRFVEEREEGGDPDEEAVKREALLDALAEAVCQHHHTTEAAWDALARFAMGLPEDVFCVNRFVREFHSFGTVSKFMAEVLCPRLNGEGGRAPQAGKASVAVAGGVLAALASGQGLNEVLDLVPSVPSRDALISKTLEVVAQEQEQQQVLVRLGARLTPSVVHAKNVVACGDGGDGGMRKFATAWDVASHWRWGVASPSEAVRVVREWVVSQSVRDNNHVSGEDESDAVRDLGAAMVSLLVAWDAVGAFLEGVDVGMMEEQQLANRGGGAFFFSFLAQVVRSCCCCARAGSTTSVEALCESVVRSAALWSEEVSAGVTCVLEACADVLGREMAQVVTGQHALRLAQVLGPGKTAVSRACLVSVLPDRYRDVGVLIECWRRAGFDVSVFREDYLVKCEDYAFSAAIGASAENMVACWSVEVSPHVHGEDERLALVDAWLALEGVEESAFTFETLRGAVRV